MIFFLINGYTENRRSILQFELGVENLLVKTLDPHSLVTTLLSDRSHLILKISSKWAFVSSERAGSLSGLFQHRPVLGCASFR